VVSSVTTTQDDRLRRATTVAAAVVDPEIPVITIGDLGVLRGVRLRDDGAVLITITPTYSGCPALDQIRSDVERELHAAGFDDVVVQTELAPAWSTDEITPAGHQALADYGIVPPAATAAGPRPLELGVRCPACGSIETVLTSRFGATSCKALWRCQACSEPFEVFKTL
jgi:ring-1,2-phenylacetyl-CoA epoxidase subunit PaaD